MSSLGEARAEPPQYPHSVQDLLAQNVVVSSRGRSWSGVEVMRSSNPNDAFDVDGLHSHTLAINVGRAYRLEGRVDSLREDAVMHRGAMKIVAAGPKSQWRWDRGAAIEVLHVSIDDGSLRMFAVENDLPRPPEIRTRVGFVDAELGRFATLLEAELRQPAHGPLVVDSLRINVIGSLLRGYSSLTGTRLPQPKSMGATVLRRIDDYVNAHLGNDFGVDELAALAGLSRFHFMRVFRATVGASPHQYVMARRIERARALLSTARPLHDIANATGFFDQSHLTREMKRHFGIAPGALRARRSARISKTEGAKHG